MNRRAFLGSTLGLWNHGALFQKKLVTLGFSLYGISSLSIPDAIKVVAEIGYDDVELACLAGYPGDPAQLDSASRRQISRTLDQYQIPISAFMENLTLLVDARQQRENLERIRRVAQLARDLGYYKPPIVMETTLGGLPGDWEKVKEQMAEKLREWMQVAATEKIIVAIKPHVQNALQAPSQATWLRENVGSSWLKFTYDFSHFYLQHLSLKETLTSMLPHCSLIHVKDASGTADRPEFRLPGDGSLDYDSYFRILKNRGYQGSITVEVSAQLHRQPGYNAANAARCQRSSENVEIWTVPVRWQDYCKVTLQYHPLIIEASSADGQDSGAAAVQKNTFLHDRQHSSLLRVPVKNHGRSRTRFAYEEQIGEFPKSPQKRIPIRRDKLRMLHEAFSLIEA